MSKRVIGSLEVQGNLQINGKYAMRIFNGLAPDTNTGDVNYPFYRKDVIDSMLGMLPVSRIGTMDYLPVNVSGSFVGASNYSYVHYVEPMIIEDDGTAVLLRSGTNGSTFGYYYTYIRNIRNLTSITQDDVVSTNTPYKPAVLTSTQSITDFYTTNAYELLFFRTANTAGADTYILSLTNGTLNQVSHEPAQFPLSTFTNFDPINASVVNGTIFIWGKDTTITNGGYALVLYTVPVASIRAGNITSMQRITGFNGSTLLGQAYTAASNIRIYDRYSSTNSADLALYTYSSPITSIENWQQLDKYNIYCVPNSTNTTVRVAIWLSARAQTPTGLSSMYGSGFSFVYNISTKTITYDQTIGQGIVISATSAPVFTRNDPYEINTTNINGYPLSLGNTGSICQTNDGYLVANKSRWVSSATYGVQAGPVTPTNLYDSWNLTTRTLNAKVGNINPIFGSAIGENLLGVRFVTNNKIVLACAGTDNGVTTNYDSYSTTTLGSTYTYTYPSLQHGTLTGYDPQARSLIGNSNDEYTAMISLVEANGNVSAYASSFVEGYSKPVLGKYNTSTGVFDGTYSITDTVLQTIKSDIITASAVTGITKSLITLYYVPDSTFGHSIAVVKCRNSTTNIGTIIYAEVDLVLSSSAIISGTVFSTTVDTSYSNTLDVASGTLTRRFNGLTIAKYSGFSYIGIGSTHAFAVPANTSWIGMVGKIKGGTLTSHRSITQSYSQTGGLEPGVLPSVGFGLYDHTWSDVGTKSVFGLYGTSEAELDGLVDSTGTVSSRIVVTSQDVPQGYNVYITQEIPVFLGGVFYKIPPTSFDLTTIKPNPASSTFYIYVQMNRTTRVASYLISETLIPESLTSTYIGTIVTSASGIDTISTEKVTRFMTYRPSVTKRGSAIPCSTGVPSGTGTRWH